MDEELVVRARAGDAAAFERPHSNRTRQLAFERFPDMLGIACVDANSP